ncbi:MAG: hypothetical protein H7Y88_03545 [Phycisphaerales bacterium]|nr:hypothetical protein [Phycisphaerales bacterium]
MNRNVCRTLLRLLSVAGAVGISAGLAVAADPEPKNPVPAKLLPSTEPEPWAELIQEGMTQDEIDALAHTYKEAFGGGDPLALRGPGPANDLCPDAAQIVLVAGGSAQVIANNVSATDDLGLPTCGLTASASSGHLGMWYKFTGTGNTVTISLCNGPALDMVLRVFCNGCAQPVCAAANDDACDAPNGLGPTLSFCTTAGSEYHILVSRYATTGAGGDFVMDVIDDGTTCFDPPACVFVPPPANDVCDGAIPVTIGSSGTFSNVSATADAGLPACTPSAGTFGSGVWFSVAGNGSLLSVDTCGFNTSFNTKIGVYTGFCGGLTCVTSDAADPCGSNGALATFCAADQLTYYILVSGDTTAEGTFDLAINALGACPTNDTCDGAIPVAIGSFGTFTNIGASADAGLPTCVPTAGTFGSGVWFSLVGNGDLMQVDTCGFGTNFNTKIGVYTGFCGGLSCVASDASDPCGTNAALSTFCAADQQTYYILVSGDTTAQGTFDLAVTDLGGCPIPAPNDLCENAISLSVPSSGVYTNFNATNDPGQPACNGFSTFNAGVWFTLTGTGDRIAVSMCGFSTDFNTRVYVYTGGCGFFTCVAANAVGSPACDARPDAARASFCSNPGETYTILVTNDTTGTGTFDLVIDNLGSCAPPANDTCDGAIALGAVPPFGTVTVTGNTANATVDSEAFTCNSVTAVGPGVWYSVIGNGNILTVSTCSPNTTFNTKLSIFDGACFALNCVTANSDAGTALCTPADRAQLNFCSVAETTYYVFVHGSTATTTGQFELTVTDTGTTSNIPVNDSCEGAIALTLPVGGSVSAIGATTCATADADLPTCGTTYTAPGIWYTFTGTGNLVSVGTCGPIRDYDTKINVLTGFCGGFTCVGGNDDGPTGYCGESPVRASFLEFCTTAGQTYFVLVQGFLGATGNFELTIADGVSCAPPANDECETAAAITCDPSGTTILTVDNRFATQGASDPDLSCGGVGFGTMWFTFVAGGTDVTINTCDYTVIDGNDDTLLALYEGVCGGLVELECDDDSCTTPTFGSLLAYSGLVPGNTYYIELLSFSAAEQGIYQMTLAHTCGSGGADCNQNGTPDSDEIAANPALDCFDPDATPVGGFNTKGGPNGVLDACECAADWNRDNVVGSSDITAFLGSWFNDLQTQQTKADFDCSGVTGSSDITAFLNRWFQNLVGNPPFNGCVR